MCLKRLITAAFGSCEQFIGLDGRVGVIPT